MGTSTSRSRRSGFNPLLAFLLIVVAVVATVATLHFSGKIEIQAIDRLLGREVQAAQKDDGKLGAPIASLSLRPGHQVTWTDLWDPAADFYRFARLEPKTIEEAGIIREPGRIEGRVLGRPKAAGRPFTEADFLPPGTQPGPMSLVPDGMYALTLDSSKVRGLDKLAYQGRFNLVVSQKPDSELFETAKKALKERRGSQLERQLQVAQLEETTYQRVLVRNGMMIEGVDPAKKQREKDVIVAIAPDEVMPLEEALVLDHAVVCVAHTGKAGVEMKDTLSDQQTPVERLEWIWKTVQEVELIEGDERKSMMVPKMESETQ